MDSGEADPCDEDASSSCGLSSFGIEFDSSQGQLHLPITVAGPSSLEDSTFPEPKLTPRDHLVFATIEQGQQTYNWLSSNYELSEGYSLPKSLIYNHYHAFCKERKFVPVNMACFGKVMRHMFPHLKTRRLGSRGQSKYHYYGIKVKIHPLGAFGTSNSCEQSGAAVPFYTSNKMDNLQLRNAPVQGAFSKQLAPDILQCPPQVGNSSLVWASSTLLPEFPDASQIAANITEVSAGQVNYLITSYRSHCIQVLETVLRGGLSDIGFLIKHFWQHLNESFRSMLSHVFLGDTIAMCDTHLYHTVVSVLIPGAVQALPTHLLKVIRSFACCHERQVENALKGLPRHIITAKVSVAKQFVQMLHRKTTLAHLAQASRSILSAEGSVSQMKDDWEKRTEHSPVSFQVAWCSYDSWGMGKEFTLKKMNSYGQLLEGGHTVEDHIHWLEMLVKEKLDQIEKESEKSDALKSLILQWTYLSHLVVRDQTLRSAVSFGSFHLLNLLYQEYLLYIMDIHHCQQQETLLWKRVFGQDSQVSQRFLTYPVMCDLEECILRDNPYKTTGKGQTPVESIPTSKSEEVGSLNASGIVIGPSGPVHLPQSSQKDQHHSQAGGSSRCVPGETSHPSSSSCSVVSTGDPPNHLRHPGVPPVTKGQRSSKTNKWNEAARPLQPQAKTDCPTETSDSIKKVMPPSASKSTSEQETEAPCDSELSTKLVKVVPIHKEEVGKDGDAKKQADPFFIKISIPKSDEVKVVSGQVLMTEDGRSFLIDEVEDDGMWNKTELKTNQNSTNCTQS